MTDQVENIEMSYAEKINAVIAAQDGENMEIRVRQVAKLIRCSPSSVWRWKDGKIEPLGVWQSSIDHYYDEISK